MSGQLEIAALIEKRMRELGLSRADLAARLGYLNFAKGMRRIDEVCQGQLDRRFELDATKPRWTFHQALRVLNKRVRERHTKIIPFFGAPTGIVINFDPDRAVRYDLDGHALEILRGAVRLGATRVSVGGKPMPRVFELG